MNIIINKKKIKIEELKSFKDKFCGLMFIKKKINSGIVLIKCNCIHTFFMKQSIDVCITNKDNIILYKKENLHPNKIILPIKNGYYTYELPLNSAKYLKLNNVMEIKK